MLKYHLFSTTLQIINFFHELPEMHIHCFVQQAASKRESHIINHRLIGHDIMVHKSSLEMH